MITLQTIIAYVEELTGHPLNRDEGVQHGSPDREVKHLLVCWMATTGALEQATTEGADSVLTHESLYYPYDAIVRQDNPVGWEEWQTNSQRREYLRRSDLALVRVHGSLDEICVFDDFADLLGLRAPVLAEGLVKVYEIPPCSLSQLVVRVKERTGMPAVRVSHPNGMEQIVHRVGLPWGGLGLHWNVGYQQKLVEFGCDVFIAGETDSYGFRFSGECGIPMIETSHEVSEDPGLRRFTRMLRVRFPQLKVTFHECLPVFDTI